MKGILSRVYNKASSLIDGVNERRLIKAIKHSQIIALEHIHDTSVIRCVFLVLFDEVWKCDKIYQIMSENPRFEPIILVCPVVNFGRDNMLQRMEKCYAYFKKKNYNVVKSYDVNTNSYIDIKRDLRPDILFYTNPYKGVIDDRYYITNYQDVLTTYVPYYYHEGVGYKVAYDSLFQNLLWRRYAETPFHRMLSQKYARNKGRNTVLSGYPGIECFIDHRYMPNDEAWKNRENGLKRIIWAPHHTLINVGTCVYSCFLEYSDFMLDMAQKYETKAQFIFKPHPLLRNKLDKIWGKERTDAYYSKWESMPNTALKEGDYIDLFLTSDAMIHDSGSFLIEYLYVNKPVMRTLNSIPLENLYNSFAIDCLNNYYLAQSRNDIEDFIVNVINNVDPLKEQRTKFVNDVLMPKGSPSQNIVNDILDSIDNQILYRN